MRENLRKARLENNMTQKQVAEYMHTAEIEFKIIHQGAFIVCGGDEK